MTRHYSPRSFFRQVPIDLAGPLLREQGADGSELDLAPTRQGLARMSCFRPGWSWRRSPAEPWRPSSGEIFEMSSEKGTWAILDEARLRWRDDPDRLTAFIETLASQPGHFHRAMATCLEHRECWRGRHPGPPRRDPVPIGASASTWATGRRRPTRPASSTFPA